VRLLAVGDGAALDEELVDADQTDGVTAGDVVALLVLPPIMMTVRWMVLST